MAFNGKECSEIGDQTTKYKSDDVYGCNVADVCKRSVKQGSCLLFERILYLLFAHFYLSSGFSLFKTNKEVINVRAAVQ
jgi:hypothetical protein